VAVWESGRRFDRFEDLERFALRTVTEARGRFEIPGGSDEDITLLFDKPGFTRKADGWDASPEPEVRVYRLSAEAAIEGTVLGAPIGTGVLGLVENEVVCGWMESRGRYRIGGLPAGEVTIQVSVPGGPERKRTVTLREGQTAVEDFQVGEGSIRGRILLRGKPADKGYVLVRCSADPEVEDIVAASAGYFDVGGLHEGTYELRAACHPVACTYAAPVTVEVGRGPVVRDLVVPSAAVSGRVTGSEEGDGVRVTIYRYDPSIQEHPLVHGSTGGTTFRFEGLPPGKYFLMAGAFPRIGWLGPLDLGGSPAEGLVLPLKGDARLAVRLADTRDRRPLAGSAHLYVPFSVGWPYELHYAFASTDKEGTVLFEAVIPGTYRLRVTVPGYREFREEVEISGSMEKTVLLSPEREAPKGSDAPSEE
jgi:hypothetical protein